MEVGSKPRVRVQAGSVAFPDGASSNLPIVSAQASQEAIGPYARVGRSAPWDAAGSGRRTAQWVGVTGSINTAVFGYIGGLRARAHEQVLKNPHAGQIVDKVASNVVGAGIRPQPVTSDPGFNDAIEDLWEEWSAECDAQTGCDFYGLQELVVRGVVEGGEVFARHRNRQPDDGLVVPYQIQVLEAEHCPPERSEQLANGRVINGGIEFDRIGTRSAYWLYPVHPGDALIPPTGNEPERVAAPLVMHVYRPLRNGQIRGFPWLAAALARLYEMDLYEDAELVRKKVAAYIAGFITSPEVDPAQDVVPGLTYQKAREEGVFEATFQPGSFSRLYPGEDVRFSDPADVGTSFEPFLRHFLRSAALPGGITYEQLTGDYSNVNYSSARMALIEVRRGFEMVQRNVVVQRFNRPVYRRFLEQAFAAGELTIPRSMRNRTTGLAAREAFRCKWLAQGWEYVDPVKERQGEQMDVRNGFASRAEVVRSRGKNIRDLDREIAEDNARADAAKLVFDSDPRKVSKTGAAHGTPPDGEDDDALADDAADRAA